MGMGMGMMGGQLNLSDAQKAQIKAIMAEYQPKMQRIRNSNLPADQKRAKFMALRQEMQGKIDAVLTPAQREKAKQMRANRGERMQDLESCLKNLNLTAKEKTVIKSIEKSRMAQVKAVRSDTTLTDAEKRAKIMGIRKTSREQVIKVLTPAQRNDLKACMQANKK
jgi:Spy/CpxP family protein refolding chaperone